MNTTQNTTARSPRSNRKFGITPGFVGWLSRSLAVATLAAIGIGGQSAKAANLYWDPLVDGNSVIGGTGLWDTSSLFWDPIGTDALVDNVSWSGTTDVAIFGGTGGTVTLGTPITAGGLQFDVAGYTITGNTLTLSGTPTIVAKRAL